MVREPFYYFTTTKWIGAFFLWVIKGFKLSFKTMLSETYDKRNLLVGYVIQLLMAGVVIYFLL
jgi:hypothetical protein